MSNHLEDRLAVQDVMLRYASTVDEKDYEGYRALFTKDVVVVGMGRVIYMVSRNITLVERSA